MLAVMLKANPAREEGYEGLFMGREGTLTNEKGKVLKEVG